jgi:DNA-binding transcriptional MerR regulator
MANRSYLYSTGNKKPIGISEWRYNIPLSYKILVSQNAKTVNSIIKDGLGQIAIQGDFKKGRQKLYDFLDMLKNENICEKNQLDVHIAKTKEFLEAPDNENLFFHLESGEIYEMSDEDLETQNKILFENEILLIDETIETVFDELKKLKQAITEISEQRVGGLFSKRKKEEQKSKLNNLAEDMWYLLGINEWDNVLYFNPDK